MNFTINKMSPKTWESFSEYAHKASFNEIKAKDSDRIDYALLVVNDKDVPCAYQTCRELDKDTVYWQFGGVFKPVKGTINSMKIYELLADWHRDHYKRVATYIENSNEVMLKMAFKIGFRITGIRYYNGDVLLEHTMEFEDNHPEATDCRV